MILFLNTCLHNTVLCTKIEEIQKYLPMARSFLLISKTRLEDNPFFLITWILPNMFKTSKVIKLQQTTGEQMLLYIAKYKKKKQYNIK